ncbi:MAG: SDR family oxidoreductase [Candidatus Thermoplasmatota archaeon]|nr:SDR family oxidoreductase [Candidatus Thermoplasmatota archaeon]
MKSYEGKTVVITGGSKGLGRALAKEFHDRGATVITCSRNGKDTESGDGRYREFRCDLSSVEGAREFAYFLLWNTHGIDILVSNASDPGSHGLRNTSEITAEDAIRAITVNYLSPMEIFRVLRPSLESLQESLVVNVTSDVASNPEPGWGVYAASKAALETLSSLIAVEYHEVGVHSFTFNPGDMDTELHRVFLPEDRNLLDPAYSARKLIEYLDSPWEKICGSRLEVEEDE